GPIPPGTRQIGQAQRTSRIAMSEAAEHRLEPELPGAPHGLADDPLRHLRLTRGPVDEHDRDLADAEALLPRAHAGLDLERVALGLDLVERDALVHFSAERLVAARCIPQRQAGDDARVDVREIRQIETRDRP